VKTTDLTHITDRFYPYMYIYIYRITFLVEFYNKIIFRNEETIRLFRIMLIPNTFRLVRVLTSEMLCRRLPVITVTTLAYHIRRCGRI
jgi:hypothetical protein